MKVKLTYILIAILTVLGGLNLFQSLKKKLLPAPEPEDVVHVEKYRAVGVGQAQQPRLFQIQGDEVFNRRFSVSEGDLLKVDIEHADLRLSTGADDGLQVVVTLEGEDMDRAREAFEETRFRTDQEGSTITIQAEYPDDNGWSWDHSGDAEITVYVTLPERFDLDLKTSHGDVTLANHRGDITLRTSHGDVDAATLEGKVLNIQTSHGDVEVNALRGDEVTVKTSHGDIDMESVAVASFTARTSHADVEIDRLSGRADISNAHGDILLGLDKTDAAYLRTTHGDIVIETAPDLRASVTLKGERVRLGEQFGFDGARDEDRVEGQLNGGGPRLEARTSHGTVTLRQK